MLLRVEMHHYFHDEKLETNEKLDAILELLQESKTREVAMSVEMDALKVVVAATKAGIESAIVLLNGIPPLIVDAAGDKAASLALAATLTEETTALAAAVMAVPPPA